MADFGWEAVYEHLLVRVKRCKVNPRSGASYNFLKVHLNELSVAVVVHRRQPFRLYVQRQTSQHHNQLQWTISHGHTEIQQHHEPVLYYYKCQDVSDAITKSTNKNVTRLLSQWQCTIGQQETMPDFCQPNDWRKRWDLFRNMTVIATDRVKAANTTVALAAVTENNEYFMCMYYTICTILLMFSTIHA